MIVRGRVAVKSVTAAARALGSRLAELGAKAHRLRLKLLLLALKRVDKVDGASDDGRLGEFLVVALRQARLELLEAILNCPPADLLAREMELAARLKGLDIRRHRGAARIGVGIHGIELAEIAGSSRSRSTEQLIPLKENLVAVRRTEVLECLRAQRGCEEGKLALREDFLALRRERDIVGAFCEAGLASPNTDGRHIYKHDPDGPKIFKQIHWKTAQLLKSCQHSKPREGDTRSQSEASSSSSTPTSRRPKWSDESNDACTPRMHKAVAGLCSSYIDQSTRRKRPCLRFVQSKAGRRSVRDWPIDLCATD